MKQSIDIKKIALVAICLMMVTLLGNSVYQQIQLNKLSTSEDLPTAPGKFSTTSPISSLREASKPDPNKKRSNSEAQVDVIVTADIDTLEAKLDAKESELDAAYQQLDDEMSRKEALKEKERELQRQFYNSASFKNSIRNSIENQFNDFFDSLDISEEQKEKALEALVERQAERARLYPDIQTATTDEQKDDLRQLWSDIRETCDSQMEDILGTEYDTYHDYMELATTRSVIDQYKATLDSDNQLTESQDQKITEIMYNEMMQVFTEIGYDPRYDLEFDSDMNNGTADGQAQNMAKINSGSLEKSRSILSEAQYEQFEKYLNSQQEIVELASQLSD